MNLNWIQGEPKKKFKNACLLWIWDSELRIGYCNPEIAYWSGGRWTDGEGIPLLTGIDQTATWYCPLPNPKGRKSPL